MENSEIVNKLCYYDTDSMDEDFKPEKRRCFCDNCFYGRTQLAEYIIKLKGFDKTEFIKRFKTL